MCIVCVLCVYGLTQVAVLFGLKCLSLGVCISPVMPLQACVRGEGGEVGSGWRGRALGEGAEERRPHGEPRHQSAW